jgi:hypothetical protein
MLELIKELQAESEPSLVVDPEKEAGPADDEEDQLNNDKPIVKTAAKASQS